MTNAGLTIQSGLDQFLQAGRSLIMVQTFEEDRLSHILKTLAESRQKKLWIWQVNTGIHTGDTNLENTMSAEAALNHLIGLGEAQFIWMKDLHHHFTPGVIRRLRDLYYRWRDMGGAVFLSAVTREIPFDLERELAFYNLEMPSQQELTAEAEATRRTHGGGFSDLTDQVIGATLKGLTLSEARHALRRLYTQEVDASKALQLLQEEKRQLIQKTGTLEYIPNVPKLNEVGGLENLKDWLDKRRALLIDDDPAAHEITPKGILLMGVSGCGKSLCIKAVSSAWQLPLYRLEMTRVFSGAFGPAEQAFSDACRLMEKMAPAILWIDEIEMGLSAEGSTAADSSLSRIFAFFLTWMQEKPPGLFVAATANRIDLLPAEMIRKGRFDQVFFVDLPREREREEIFRIHLKRRGYDPKGFNLEVFADATEGWNGAEIEQCVIAAITNAKMEKRDLELKDMYAARKQIVPISTTMEEQVRHIRNWAYERAVRASREE